MSDPYDPTEDRETMRARCEDWAARGVVVMDPERTWIGPEVFLTAGARIWPDVVLKGTTAVGANAEIRPGCWIENTLVGTDAVIKPNSVCESARIGDGCSVGPMAHLRPGAELERGAKVGNFVEVKKSRLGPGAKANHLSYIGDARVGENANIGAGTITCNYDGHGKYRTKIGARAFIGSNTALVAPVSIGDDAIVGAGSTIATDVPAGALGVERATQKTLDGYARRIHDRNARRAQEQKSKKKKKSATPDAKPT